MQWSRSNFCSQWGLQADDRRVHLVLVHRDHHHLVVNPRRLNLNVVERSLELGVEGRFDVTAIAGGGHRPTPVFPSPQTDNLVQPPWSSRQRDRRRVLEHMRPRIQHRTPEGTSLYSNNRCRPGHGAQRSGSIGLASRASRVHLLGACTRYLGLTTSLSFLRRGTARR